MSAILPVPTLSGDAGKFFGRIAAEGVLLPNQVEQKITAIHRPNAPIQRLATLDEAG